MNTIEYLEKKFGPHKGNPHVLKGFLREDMYKMFGELGFIVGAEVGIEKGKNAVEMYDNIPGLKLYGVDSYEQHPQASYDFHAKIRNWDYDEIQKWKTQMENRMTGRNFELWQGFSEDVAKRTSDNSLDFVYIDADHSYDMVMLDMILWGRKIKKGGIVSGHDYYYNKDRSDRRAKVTQCIDDYTAIHGIKFYITGENHADQRGDWYPSWFWVKLEDVYPNVLKS